MLSEQRQRKTLESLYVLNKQAKKYRDKAAASHNCGKKATARKNSCRKSALYSIKDRVIKEIKDRAVRINLHEINGDEFYCFYFEDEDGQQWSFHTPTSTLDVEEADIDGEKELDDFSTDSEKEATNQSLKESLLHFESQFGLNANDYLEDKYVDYGRDSYFTGWKYLGD